MCESIGDFFRWFFSSCLCSGAQDSDNNDEVVEGVVPMGNMGRPEDIFEPEEPAQASSSSSSAAARANKETQSEKKKSTKAAKKRKVMHDRVQSLREGRDPQPRVSSQRSDFYRYKSLFPYNILNSA
ncbi:unnamed protein product [Orchesella dallaii]|uniref:Uncharacterized protein n=1 Tax=Orchesella dallaii TaxID=48710 RepID=A0ABP1S770_9HEXA